MNPHVVYHRQLLFSFQDIVPAVTVAASPGGSVMLPPVTQETLFQVHTATDSRQHNVSSLDELINFSGATFNNCSIQIKFSK